ncbi:MAG: anthranilate phosphoribosyltransferase [Lachnospiraceae bacterium]|nr:anthranilate phosphoribosyltransferase [Lachnospiraceae bacterium]
MIKEAISLLVAGEDMTPEMMTEVMEEIMTGDASDAQKASFLTALANKGETIEEITAAAKVMKKHCVPFSNQKDVLEIVGTGGDKSNSINISTMSSIVAAAAGQRVAKHGNRAASSKCGTADCFEKLGAKIDMDTDRAEKVFDETGMVFLFAQKYHPAMRFVGSVRREIGIRTLFNVLGPLTNPAGADIQLMGVYTEDLVEPLVKVLHNLGVKKAMAVYGTDCMDEISLSAPTKIAEYIGDEFKTYTIKPEDFGLTTCKKEDLVGGSPEENAEIVKKVFSGEKGPKRDVVLLNAGAALYLAGKADSIKDGVDLAAEVIDNGKAMKELESFIAATNA